MLHVCGSVLQAACAPSSCSTEACPALQLRAWHSPTRCSATQAVQAALAQQPTLLVLDNVTQQTAPIARLFLSPQHASSLVLATAWSADVFAALAAPPGQSQAGSAFSSFRQLFSRQPDTQLSHSSVALTVLSMSAESSLQLQRAEACQLLSQQISSSSLAAQRQPRSDTQLSGLAEAAAAALAFSSSPAYVPGVLAACGGALGEMAEWDGALSLLQQQLHAGNEPLAPGCLQPPAASQVFGQLQTCYDELSGPAQQMLTDMARVSGQLHCSSPSELALWASCRQSDACTLEQAMPEVSWHLTAPPSARSMQTYCAAGGLPASWRLCRVAER